MDPAAISTGMGEGMAQVFKPQEDFLGEAMKAAEAKKKETAENKAKVMSQLGKLAEYHVWTERDGPEFAKMQKAVWDGIQGKDINSPETMLWLNQKQQELTYLADLSNTAKEQYIKGTQTYQTGGDKYFPDVVDRMQEFANPANALNKNITWNPGWFMEDPNIDKRISELGKENIATAEANKKQRASVGVIPGSDGREFVKETLTQEFSLDDAKNQVRTLLTSPAFKKAAEIKWNQDPNKANYNSVYDWAEAVYAPKLANESRIENVSQLSTGGAGAGAGGDTQRGYSITQVSQETPAINQANVDNVAADLLKRDSFKKTYEANKQVPVYDKETNTTDYVSKLPQVTLPNGKTRDMTIEEYAQDIAKNTITAQEKVEGYTYDFGRASKTGEATEINFLEVPTGKYKGVKFKPTRITFKENGEPVVIGLDIKQNTVEVPYSNIHAKLVNETGGDWNQLKQKVIKEVGFDPFTKYESKTAPSSGAKATTTATTGEAKATTNVKRDAAGNTYGGGAKPQLTEAEWNKQWAALPKGKSMVGLDGKTYTKK